MLANIKPGKPARLVGAVTTPALMALIEAKRRGQPLEPVMTKIMQAIGFDSFMYAMSSTPTAHRNNRVFVWTTLPLAWVHRYSEKGYVEVDPRVSETYNRNVPFCWDASDYVTDGRYTEFFADAAHYGVCSGVSLSFRDADHGRVVCAFNSRITPVSSERRRYVEQTVGELALFATSFHDFFMAHFVDIDDRLMLRPDPLSIRERQCLELGARGMRSIDISIKLGITERTVNFHFNNLIRKMGALNRQEAVAWGVARGWVRIDPKMLASGRRPLRPR